MVQATTAKPVRGKAPAKSRAAATARASLTLSSKNYSSWSLRGWLLARFAGLEFDEVFPQAGLLPSERAARAHCRSICGEMNSGFANLRSALPMNLKVRHKSFKIWAGAQPDIERIVALWRECLARYGGPYLFGVQRTMADAMYAPVVTRFLTYAVPLDALCAAYAKTIMAMPEMKEWAAAALKEAEEIEELDMEF